MHHIKCRVLTYVSSHLVFGLDLCQWKLTVMDVAGDGSRTLGRRDHQSGEHQEEPEQRSQGEPRCLGQRHGISIRN